MSPEVYEFEDVRVDLRRMEVLRAGRPVPLEPKAFDVFRYLIEHRDRLVTKDELLDAVWRDTFVTPNALTRVIAQLRKALGDDAFEARYVETVAKRGYRFIAAVTVVGPGRTEPTTTEPARGDPRGPVDTAAQPAPVFQPRRHLLVTALSLGLMVAAMALAVFFAVRSRPPAVRATTPVAGDLQAATRLSVGSASYRSPAISPDGRSVAYASDQSGGMEIYVVGFAPGSKEQAITGDGGQNTQVRWSPDGQWLAYHSNKKGGIWIVQSSGGTPRQVATFGSDPSWAPDSLALVFKSDAGGMAAQSTIWTVSREGSNLQQITQIGNPKGGHHSPAWSPDGRFLVFLVTFGSARDALVLMSMADKHVHNLGVALFGNDPQFAPDGRSIYWVGGTQEGNGRLWRVQVDPTTGEATSGQEAMFSFGSEFVDGFSMARDGTAVVSLYKAQANIWAIDLNGDSPVGKPVALTMDDVRDGVPNYSNDGRIVFHQQVVGRPQSAWIMDDDGKNRRALSAGMELSTAAEQWSPDSKRIFALTFDLKAVSTVTPSPDNPIGVKGAPALNWIDVATGQLSRIPISPDGISNPRLSPDGREIAFHVIGPDGAMNVWRQPVDGGARTQLTFDKEAVSYPCWAPDGRSLAVEVKRGDQTYVGVVSRDGGPVDMLVTDRGQNWPHSWAPDNDRMAFAGERDGVWNLFSVSRKTRTVKQLTHFESVDGYVRYPSWSPRGNRIVFEWSERMGSIWSVKLP
jgi:Tol biopolymer transport system component/DNA-binding winged helix-turn-helix (wHTH) protein